MELIVQRRLLIAFAVLLLAAIAAMVWTSDWFAPDILHREQASNAEKIVNQSPLQTARTLAPLASSPEEQALAQEALHTADQEVDLAFESAIRNAIEHPPTLTPEARKIEAQVTELEARVKAGQVRVAQLLGCGGGESGNGRINAPSNLTVGMSDVIAVPTVAAMVVWASLTGAIFGTPTTVAASANYAISSAANVTTEAEPRLGR